jgi:hypothetical protein
METETLLPLTRLNHVCDLIRAHAEDHREIRQTLNELLTILDGCSGPIALYREKIAAAIDWVGVFIRINARGMVGTPLRFAHLRSRKSMARSSMQSRYCRRSEHKSSLYGAR